jgi:hypothetical protein
MAQCLNQSLQISVSLFRHWKWRIHTELISLNLSWPCRSSDGKSPAFWVQTQVRSCGICGGQSGTWADFLWVLYIPLTAPYSSSSGAATVGQTVADVPSGLSLIPPPRSLHLSPTEAKRLNINQSSTETKIWIGFFQLVAIVPNNWYIPTNLFQCSIKYMNPTCTQSNFDTGIQQSTDITKATLEWSVWVGTMWDGCTSSSK